MDLREISKSTTRGLYSAILKGAGDFTTAKETEALLWLFLMRTQETLLLSRVTTLRPKLPAMRTRNL